MPFAWAAINIIDLITGNQSSGTSGHTAVITQDSNTAPNRRDSSGSTGGGGTQERVKTMPEYRRRDIRSSSVSSQTSRSVLADETTSEETVNITQNFAPVTLTLNLFIKQVSVVENWFQKPVIYVHIWSCMFFISI